MKIAYFVGRFPLISETFIVAQIAGMIERRHDVTIFATHRAGTDVHHELVSRFDLLKRTVFLPPISAGFLARILPAARTLVRSVARGKPGVSLRSLNPRRFGRQAVDLRLLARLEPFLDTSRFDIVHCQFGDIAERVLPIFTTGALSGAIVVSFRGWDLTQYVSKHPGCYEQLFARASALLPVSESLRLRLEELGAPHRKVQVLRSGIDLERFSFRGRRAMRDRPLIVTVGRLTEKKGIEFGIRAVHRLLSAGRAVDYRIVGDGPYRDSLMALVDELGVRSNVEFFGSKRSDEVLEILQEADVFVAPSVTGRLGNKEGIPNSLKEAMAVGVPVVATRHGGIPELVEDNVSGYLVEERDVDGLADRIGLVVDKPAIADSLVDAARKTVEERFDIGRLNDELESLYYGLVNSKQSNG